MTAPELSPIARLAAPVRFVLGLGVLVGFAAAGQALVTVTHLPLPGSVVGLALLWAALGLKAVRLHWVADAADGLLGILGLLFVPATVGFIGYLSAGAGWGLWLLVMTAGLLLGGGVAGVLASRLAQSEQHGAEV
ncbi:CidA/LrgA family protein [Deinococcus humi]|uniref:Holin-like protein n=1 Tax=Deinococcus humi TaxID=662880 RepID=A0A7W8JU95_9DEIO|nr:CidA/LrgA family protein [Deinococcus humi]MBB5361916.1 holin-like protein [Deinococcus humi]GGO22999.1 CidA/LrgA family protein [Deinococcus humi]